MKETGILSELFILTDGFSPYIVSYTVEFHNGDAEVVIEGGTQILLSTLITKLGLTRDDGSSFTADDNRTVRCSFGFLRYLIGGIAFSGLLFFFILFGEKLFFRFAFHGFFCFDANLRRLILRRACNVFSDGTDDLFRCRFLFHVQSPPGKK